MGTLDIKSGSHRLGGLQWKEDQVTDVRAVWSQFYDLHTLSRLVWWKTELLKDFAQQGYHIYNRIPIGLEAGHYITLRLRSCFRCTIRIVLTRKKYLWKSESNVIFNFAFYATLSINIFGVMRYENSSHETNEHLNLRSESTKIFMSLKLFSK